MLVELTTRTQWACLLALRILRLMMKQFPYLFFFFWVVLFWFITSIDAQNATTDPSEGENKLHLDWTTRFNICLSTARGLAYLHEESSPRIVHRDVKASNILLDGELCPKISDFGLAKLYDDKKTHITSCAAGTIKHHSPMQCDYLEVAIWHRTKFDENQALRVIGVALLCTQASPSMRPSMSRVIAMLVEDIEVSTVKTKPSYLTYGNLEDITASTTFTNEESQTSIVSDSSYSGIE
ncbi:hypothetical protein V6N12_029558 [Hibiscus sabdariffa]|uniref:Protein kinase domain-containing protein n=1 Tax=Hibiscus sabdariffa TaxID=183260 RepID=A0ABR2CWJ6_9ROSI